VRVPDVCEPAAAEPRAANVRRLFSAF
jgi:hypothetical protein